MRRRTLISRARHQFWLAHKIASHQPLVARVGKHRRLAQEADFPGTLAEAAGRVIVLREQYFKHPQQIALPSFGPALQPAFISQPESDYEEAPAPDELAGFLEQQAANVDLPSLPVPEAEEISTANEPEAIPELQTGAPFVVPEQELMNANRFSILPYETSQEAGRDERLPASASQDTGRGMSLPASASRNDEPSPRVPTSLPQRDGDVADQQAEQAAIRDYDHSQEQPIIQATTASTFEPEMPPVQVEEIDPALVSEEIYQPPVSEEVNPAVISEEIYQPPNIYESVDTQSRQEHVDSQAQPVENVKPKRQRARIQEQPAGVQHTQPVPPSPGNPHMNSGQKTPPKEAGVRMERSGQKRIAADDLFVPREIDRSLQTWMARLAGTNSTVHDDATSPEIQFSILPGEPSRNSVGASPGVHPVGGNEIAPETQIVPENEIVLGAGRTPGDAPTQFRTHANNSLQTESGQFANMNSTPLSQRTIRFLQPLVGIDPANIRVHHDALAEHLTDQYQADAVTIGDDVEVAAGHQDDTPETLGLLAHEFTHVARRQEPHFIPPIVRSVRSSLSVSDQASLADEEALAQQVEGRVKQIAQQQIDQAEPTFIEPPDMTVALPSGTPDPGPAMNRSQPDAWGGLPAPWDPLPGWMVPSPTPIENHIQATTIPSYPSQESQRMNVEGNRSQGINERYEGNGGMDAWTASTEGNAGVQRAGQERSSSQEDAQPATSTLPDEVKAPEPDLDALARQVYTLLKRRLRVEHLSASLFQYP